MRIQSVVVVAVAALSLWSIGCATETTTSSPASNQGSASTTDPNGTDDTRSGTPTSAAGVTGTCDAACTYYLSCKGAASSYQAECVQSCTAQGYTSEDLAAVQQLDCTSAVEAIEGSQPAAGGSGTGSSGSSGGGGSKGADCFSCQHDGTSCIYIGPMGGYSQCDPSCC
jgi:hypothetical protein